MKVWKLLGACAAASGFLAATPAQAEDWRICYVMGCLNNQCGDLPTAAYVTTAVQFDDPAYGGESLMMEELKAFGENVFPSSRGWEFKASCGPSVSSEPEASNGLRNFISMMGGQVNIQVKSSGTIWSRNMASAESGSDASHDEASSNESPSAPTPSNTADASTDSSSSDRDREAEAARRQADQERREAEASQAAERKAAEQAAADRAAQSVKAEQEAAAAKLREDFDKRNGLGNGSQASTDTDANQCVASAGLQQDASSKGNTAAYVVNGCGQAVDVRICLMTEANGWNCGVISGVAPQDRRSYSSFHATGQVFVDARISGNNRPLASPN